MTNRPKLLQLYPAPWFASMGGDVKAGPGIWVCQAGSMATDMVELANECANFERDYLDLIEGRSIVMPSSREHAEKMLLVAEKFLEHNPPS